MGIGGEGSSGRNRPQWMLPHLTWPAGPVHAHGGRTRTQAEAAVSTGYQKRKEDWKSLSETRHAPRRSAPSPRSTGPAAGAGRRARRAATSSVAEDGSRTARKAGLRGAEGWGLAEAAQPASHGPAILEATLGGDAGPRQEAAEQAVGLAVEPVRDGAGAEVR